MGKFKEYYNELLGESPVKDKDVDYSKPKMVKKDKPVSEPEPKTAEAEKTYKKKAFKPIKLKVGDIYFDKERAKAGYYNYRKILSVPKGSTVMVKVCDYDGTGGGNEYLEKVSYAQDCFDDPKRKKHEEQEDANEVTFNVLKKIGRFKGGDLLQQKVRDEFKNVLKKLKEVTDEYGEKDSSIPAGPNSMTFRASRSGTPIRIEYDDVHRGGYYGSNTMFAVQIQVGGGISSIARAALMQVASEIIGKYHYESSLGKSGIRTTDGTNWSSVMLTAPSNYNSYTPLRLQTN